MFAPHVLIGDPTSPFGNVHFQNKQVISQRLLAAAMTLAFPSSVGPSSLPSYPPPRFLGQTPATTGGCVMSIEFDGNSSLVMGATKDPGSNGSSAICPSSVPAANCSVGQPSFTLSYSDCFPLSQTAGRLASEGGKGGRLASEGVCVSDQLTQSTDCVLCVGFRPLSCSALRPRQEVLGTTLRISGSKPPQRCLVMDVRSHSRHRKRLRASPVAAVTHGVHGRWPHCMRRGEGEALGSQSCRGTRRSRCRATTTVSLIRSM